MSWTRPASALVLLVGVVVATPDPPASAARRTYVMSVETLGTMGALPSHADGWWRGPSPKPWYADELTSYCANPPDGHNRWGTLTHPRGYELTESGYGENAYMMYDPSSGWIRAANVDPFSGRLVPATRFDTCRSAGDPPPEDPPPAAPPPHLRGDAPVVGSYSCNTTRPTAGPSRVDLQDDGTLTVTPDRTASASPSAGEGTWWSYPGDPADRGGGASLRTGVFTHFQGETVELAVTDDGLTLSGFTCTRLDLDDESPR